MQIHKVGTMIDGQGGTPVAGALLAIEGGDIIYAGNADGFDIPDGAEVIEHGQKYLLPGLIDAHTHFLIDPLADFTGFAGHDSQTLIAWRGIKNLRRILRNGVTYIRDLGGYRHIDIELRRLLQAGEMEGPGVLAAGEFVTMTGGHCWKLGREADGEAEVRKAVREQLKAGADLIKIMASGGNLSPGSIPGAAQFSVGEIRAACEEAHKAGKRTTTHAHSVEAIRNALKGGIDCIEHANYADRETMEMMRDSDVYYVTTLFGPWICAEEGREKGLDKEVVDKCRRAKRYHRQAFEHALAAGVKIAAGTDSGTPFCEHGSSLIRELQLMTKYGMQPMQAIVSATRNGADCLGILERYGTLEAGKAADFIIAEEDPMRNICALAKLKAVYKNGKRVDL